MKRILIDVLLFFMLFATCATTSFAVTDEEYNALDIDSQILYDEGYYNGYDAGYEEGYNEGYRKAEDDNIDLSDDDYEDSYEEGYDDGFYSGYDYGYDDACDDLSKKSVLNKIKLSDIDNFSNYFWLYFITIASGLTLILLIYLYNSNIFISIEKTEAKLDFISRHYCRKLHYNVYENRAFTIWVYFIIFSISIILTLFWKRISFCTITLSIVYLISEIDKFKNAYNEAHFPAYKKKLSFLSSDSGKFQAQLFEESSDRYQDDFGTYALIDPRIFSLPAIYKISLANIIALSFLIFLLLVFNVLIFFVF